jgi:AcrR family transcriptional regulator
MPRLSKARKEMLTCMMKESIFEAASSVLCEHGIDGTTMNRVAETADLAKSSLYDYFPSKEELLRFVSDRLVVPFIQAVEETVRTDLPAPQKLERIVRRAFENATKHKAIVKLVVQANQQYQVRQKIRPRILQAFTAIFQQGIEEGAFHPYPPALASRMFLGSFHELFELLATSPSESEAWEYMKVLIDAALHGLSIHVGSSAAAGAGSSCQLNP